VRERWLLASKAATATAPGHPAPSAGAVTAQATAATASGHPVPSAGAVTAKATAATASGPGPPPPPSSSLARLPRRPPQRCFRLSALC
jgi:hypothetical protein